jgi:hypothetical protein
LKDTMPTKATAKFRTAVRTSMYSMFIAYRKMQDKTRYRSVRRISEVTDA